MHPHGRYPYSDVSGVIYCHCEMELLTFGRLHPNSDYEIIMSCELVTCDFVSVTRQE